MLIPVEYIIWVSNPFIQQLSFSFFGWFDNFLFIFTCRGFLTLQLTGVTLTFMHLSMKYSMWGCHNHPHPSFTPPCTPLTPNTPYAPVSVTPSLVSTHIYLFSITFSLRPGEVATVWWLWKLVSKYHVIALFQQIRRYHIMDTKLVTYSNVDYHSSAHFSLSFSCSTSTLVIVSLATVSGLLVLSSSWYGSHYRCYIQSLALLILKVLVYPYHSMEPGQVLCVMFT